MDLPKNKFKAAIKNGELQLGIWSSLCSPAGSEILSQSAFDWILFDTEHSPVEIAGMFPLLQAAAAGNTSSVMRVAWNDKVLLKKALDIGAQSILLPFIQNAQEAADAVYACSYPPNGIRGISVSTRAGGYGRIDGYLQKASAEICIMVQVETGEALGNLKEIAETPGIDGVFIGPSDLCASLGHIGDHNHPDVQKAIKDALATIKTAGKPAGILTLSTDDAKRYIDWGFTFVACGIDVALLTKSVDQLHATMSA